MVVHSPLEQRRYDVEMSLRLSPFTIDDECAAIEAHEQMVVDGHRGFLLFWEETASWREWVQANNDAALGRNLAPRWVAATQLKAVVDGEIVGRVSIRFELNDHLFHYGGHVGYYVVPNQRGQGYAREMLRQSLVIARSRGVGRVLIICDDVNEASARVAQSCGGVLEAVVPDEDGTLIRRYWID